MTTFRRTVSMLLGSVLLGASLAAVVSVPARADLTPTERITPAQGCHDLVPGWNGVKVGLVQRRLGMPASTWETMDAATVGRVRSFQSTRALRRDGVVDRATWQALGIPHDFCVDAHQVAPQLGLGATAVERRETFVRAAESYLGAEYVWGGAGPEALGIDCSGLVLQALYAAGVDPQPISVDLHPRPAYRTSVELYRLPGMSTHPLSQVRRGDLVFYTKNTTGVVNHVAVYVGGGMLVEAKDADVHHAPLQRTLPSQTVVQTVVRPFTPVGTEADRRYVSSLYLDYLGRPAGAHERDSRALELVDGTWSRHGLSRELATSEEYLGSVVDRAYRDVLSRPADPAGRAGWVRELRGGLPVSTMSSAFYASREHYLRSGATPTDASPWVVALYREILGRPPGQAEVDHWLREERLRGRLHVAAAFHGSQESLLRRTDSLYRHLLGRGADAHGLSTWPGVVSREGDLSLAAHLTGSPEYYARAQGR
ncbi:DUF4214 domain-containing protein [Aquipuribacter hungaricus]|uniref:DUF4214 domain-containing protein n=1 Tax=Aquipuribacter hungaricus TaxID=545624 RepID=A0ABV7WD60_9MICO